MDAVDLLPGASDAPGEGEGIVGQASVEAEGSPQTPESTKEPIAVDQQEEVLADEPQHAAHDGMDTSAESDKTLKRTSTIESDSDDHENRLKRKMSDRVPSTSNDVAGLSASEPIKRARDETEEDDNPRERKRPSPPPEPTTNEDSNTKSAPEPETPASKVVCLTASLKGVNYVDFRLSTERFLILRRSSVSVCTSKGSCDFWL